MPKDDQLMRGERIRLEALAQSIALNMTVRQIDLDIILERAERIEDWLRKGGNL